MDLNIRIHRKAASFQYMRWPERPPAWDNNDGNNSLDRFELFLEGDVILSCPVQTVANLAGISVAVHASDTIAAGEFFIRAFVHPRLYKCRPHGIVGARTLKGDLIGADSTTDTNKLRWLVHDWKNYSNVETRVAWSAGCFVLPIKALELFNQTIITHGVKKGQLVPCSLIEEA